MMFFPTSRSRLCSALFLCALAAAPFSQGHAATEFIGNVTSDQFKVVDGDGLKIKKMSIRLQGIDAFEDKQSCYADGAFWPCGRMAEEALKEKVKDKTILCNIDELGYYGRPIATCYIDGEDLNAWIVQNGWAVVNKKYSKTYVAQEEEAKREKRGAWRGEFVNPWDWRHGRYGE